jgi:hypothetical protein
MRLQRSSLAHQRLQRPAFLASVAAGLMGIMQGGGDELRH